MPSGATNTTVSRMSVQGHRLAHETGGLSGAPLMNQSTMVLRKLRTRLPDSIPVIGVGGILSGADAVAKMAAGASMVQFYTGMVYRGPELVHECVEAIRRRREHRSGGVVPPA
jgi:dihydroorotate dehydrogenase